MFKEVYRVLRLGGFFYVDHEIVQSFMKRYHFLIKVYRFFGGVEDRYYKTCTLLTKEQFRLAEYHTYFEPGVDPNAVCCILRKTGFKEETIFFHCYGINKYMNKLLSWLKLRTTPKSVSPFFGIIVKK
jgi:hypothetical protein